MLLTWWVLVARPNAAAVVLQAAHAEPILSPFFVQLRNSENGKVDQEEMFQKLEQTGFEIGSRYAER
jgi:hypothetical protein